MVQMILYQLLTEREVTFGHISELMPFLERSLRVDEPIDRLPSPRVLKTHLPRKQVSRWPGRYIYVYRDGRDVLVSYFHMYKNYVNPMIEFLKFFEDFLAGRVQYGSWFQHVATWTTHQEPHVLFVRYEDLIRETKAEIKRIAEFIGVSILPERNANILEQCSFEFMRRNEAKFAPGSPAWPGRGPGTFIREGRSGGWKDLMTQDQQLAFEQVAKKYAVSAAGNKITNKG